MNDKKRLGGALVGIHERLMYTEEGKKFPVGMGSGVCSMFASSIVLVIEHEATWEEAMMYQEVGLEGVLELVKLRKAKEDEEDGE